MSPLVPKVMLAAMPFLLLGSVDRLLAIKYVSPVRNTLFMPHPTRGWTFRPGGGDVVFGEETRVNAQGFRGPEIPYEKAANEHRVLFLGDSVAVGFGVREEEGFVRRIATLSQAHEGPAHVTTVNCSVRSYSPWQQVDLLGTEGLRYDPDVIVHAFCLNDYVEKFQLTGFGGWSPGPHDPIAPWLSESGLYRMFRSVLARNDRADHKRRLELLESYSVANLIAEPDAPRFEDAWQITFDNLSRMRALARTRRRPFAIVCLPYALQLHPDAVEHPAPQARLAGFARAQDVPFLDLLGAFRAHASDQGLSPDDLFLDSCHLTPLGHAIAAREIHAFLGTRNLLPTKDSRSHE